MILARVGHNSHNNLLKMLNFIICVIKAVMCAIQLITKYILNYVRRRTDSIGGIFKTSVNDFIGTSLKRINKQIFKSF